MQNGCENCEEMLQIQGSTDRVLDCTSDRFSGFVAIMKPESSWVSRWLASTSPSATFLERRCQGAYAIKAFGKLPDDIMGELEDRVAESN